MDAWMKKIDHAEAVKEGRAEGHAKGLAEGIAEGLAEGRAEGAQSKTIEIVKNMLKANMKMSDISNLLVYQN